MSTPLALLVGAWIGAPIGMVVASWMIAGKRADERLRHVTIIENTRTNDGARLLGDIEDALRMAEHAEMGAPR